MKITVLSENTSCDARLIAEHGLSLFIETAHHRILFDTGQSDLFIKNAQILGIDLKNVDLAVISHGHYDHGGGLKYFLSLNDHAPVVLSRCAFEPHFNRLFKDIGLDPKLESEPRLRLIDKDLVIDDEVTVFSSKHVPLKKAGEGALTVKEGDVFVPDDFRHECYLLVTENEKRVLFSACSHRGIIPITTHFSPDVLVGGFHLMNLTNKRILFSIASELDRCETDFFTCHCTGEDQAKLLKEKLPRLNILSTGQTVVI